MQNQIFQPNYGFRPKADWFDRLLPTEMVADNYKIAYDATLTNGTTITYITTNGRQSVNVGMGDTDENFFQAQTLMSAILADGTIGRVRGAVNLSATSDINYLVGFSSLNTSIASTTTVDSTDYILLHKLEDATSWALTCRKASGTAESYTIPNLTIAADVWLDFDIVAVASSTAGAGTVYVSTGITTTAGRAMTNHMVPFPILTQFPDTVSQYVSYGARQQSTSERFVRLGALDYSVVFQPSS